jgi:hypothetical protein
MLPSAEQVTAFQLVLGAPVKLQVAAATGRGEETGTAAAVSTSRNLGNDLIAKAG